MMKKILFLIAILTIQISLEVDAHTECRPDTLMYVDVSSSIQMNDILYIKKTGWEELYSIPEHPSFDLLRTESITEHILKDINSRKKEVGDTLRTADIFYCWLPYFEWLKNIDPHYDISLIVPSKYQHLNKSHEEIAEREDELRTQATIIPASFININDTLIIKTSICPDLKKGDIIKSINGVETENLLKYTFRYRHDDLPTLLNHYYFHGVDTSYDVEIIRDGIDIRKCLKGHPNMYACLSQIDRVEMEEESKYYATDYTGYIKVPVFYPDNSRLFKFIRKEISTFKKKGCSSVIIDMRNNPGGSGHLVERFISMFIDKPSLVISKSERIKVSEKTINDYPELRRRNIGEIVSLKESPALKPFKLKKKYYVDGITKYILMDQGTSSTAAAICNILQYNCGAILVGEPLLRNSYVYGDVIDGHRLENPFLGLLSDDGISTTVSEVYTLAEDGVLMPDIEIPYTASEYSAGEDAVLNKLLSIISNQY